MTIDVDFREAEAWNGSVKNLTIGEAIPYGQVDVEEHI
jgi:hypothetical protein